MTKWKNKIGNSNGSGSDGETEPSTSGVDHMMSKNENKISKNENIPLADPNHGQIRNDGDTDNINKEMAHIKEQNEDVEISSAPFNNGFQVEIMPESEVSAKTRKRAGKLARIFGNVADKFTLKTGRQKSLETIRERDSSSSDEEDDDSDLEKEGTRDRAVSFERNEENEKTPSEVIDNLFKHSSEETVLKTFHEVIHMGKDLNELDRDSSGVTVLHKAVQKNFLSVAEKFLDYGIDPLACDIQGTIPLHIAIHNKYDEMAALIVSKLSNFVVRRLFGDSKSKAGRRRAGAKMISYKKDKRGHYFPYNGTFDETTVDPMFTINDLISRDLDKTLVRVLDSFMEEQQNGLYVVHVKLLDTDDKGREPVHKDFDFKTHTAFQNLASFEKKDALNHPVLRTYVEHKWKKWCQKRFLFYCCLYLFSLFCLSYSAVTGVTAPDVHTYNTKLQHSRAFFEVISYIFALSTLFTETRQIIRHKLHYCAQFYNFVELSSAILLVLVLPLRYTHTTAHWYIFALGYCLWAIRIFKYSIVFSQTGIYAEVIKRILAQDFVQFSILFLVVNTIFSGTFLLVLKADESLDTHVDTSSFQSIMYVGVRTLIEAGSIVDYTGYRTAGTMFMLAYMFFTIVVLLNILIAQLSETYTRTHDDCIKTVRANRAWTIARAERNEWHLLPRRPNRVKHYTSKIKNVDIKAIEKKDASDIDVVSAKIENIQNKQIKDGLEIQTVKTRLRHSTLHIEKKVDKLSTQLEEIKQLLKSK